MKDALVKITCACVGSLLTMLAGGFFATMWAKTERIFNIENTLSTHSIVDNTLGNKIGTLEARIKKIEDLIPSTDFLSPEDIENAQEKVQKTLDKEVYRAKELRN